MTTRIENESFTTVGRWPRYKGQRRNGRPYIGVRFPETLMSQIILEAKRRQWSVAHTIRHLCEASIEGIE